MKKTCMIFAVILCLVTMTAYAQTANDSSAPLWNSNATADKIVVVSDIHLGIDDSFSEIFENRELFVEFLKRLQQTGDVRELVLSGDILDDWYLPLTYPAYDDPAEFYRKVLKNNQTVVDAFNNLMASGIKLVYIPGNHDMLLASGVLDEALPGIVQARDSKGLGMYVTGDQMDIVIEHGHRYDVFSAPDHVSNKELTGSGDTILPPGYFYARIAASWVKQGRPPIKKDYPVITAVPDKSDADQYGAYIYYRVLNSEMNRITQMERFEDKVIDLKIAGFNGSYSLQDFYPIMQEDGTISAPTLFRNFQRTWAERQDMNQVKMPNSFVEAVAGTLDPEYFFKRAMEQYLTNDGEINVVVFGHTHVPDYRVLDNGKIYVNDGTWIDHNTSYPSATRTFAVITTGDTNSAVLCKYMPDGTIEDISGSVGK